ncbi:MAG: zinc metallopeptidase [Clostridia bacterium]|nr:zinc metallopeptidase [Oscillospiraceae bacterium]MBQ2746796.1 zinc metallopeptidase [Clostridia bacterium]
MPYFYGIDYYYLVLVVPAILISLIAQIMVTTAFNKYSKVNCSLTGAEAARRVLEKSGVRNVNIERVAGNLTDHYDPKSNTIRLSENVYDSTTVAAVGVACHEAGHAVQYAKQYIPIKIRAAVIPITQIGSKLSWPLLFIGLLFNVSVLVDIGIVFFGLVVLFQLITLPVEFNASTRAVSAIRDNYLLTNDKQISGVKRVLTAAAMTYVAALMVSLAQMLRLILLFSKRRR